MWHKAVTRVSSQKNEDLIFTAAEVWNLANLKTPAEPKMVWANKNILTGKLLLI
jgi:hypothetical protein